MKDPQHFMHEANRLARQGMFSGDGGPFGAVIVRKGEIIGRGWNMVLRSNDPTAHAEIVALRDACTAQGSYWLEDCHIFINCEPCPMCLAALYWAKIKTVTYGATRTDAADIGFDDNYIYREVCLPVPERSLECVQSGRSDALQIMRLWPALEGRIQY
ncbi:MAG: nucleoside deaminase [Desulfobulbaceae bacterium]|nr:nucleoside deaminase [Desulfobulbaceae bacterium]